jgi:hypothetical protein
MLSKLKLMMAAEEGIPASAEIPATARRQQQREPLHCLQLQEHLLEHGCQQQGYMYIVQCTCYMQEGLQTTAVLASKEKTTIATAAMQVTAEMLGKVEMLAKAGTSTALRNWQQQGQKQRQR